jgi:dipeptidyl aminopeptidase/acylaminoacyl peptidase
VDDWYQEHGVALIGGRAGAKPVVSDSEVLTLILAQHRLDFPTGRRWLRHVDHNLRRLFLQQLHRREFHRRGRNPWGALEELRKWWVGPLGVRTDTSRLIDSTPVKVRHWRRYAPGHLRLEGAALGYCAAKKEVFYGFRLLVMTTQEVPGDGMPMKAPPRRRQITVRQVGRLPVANLPAAGRRLWPPVSKELLVSAKIAPFGFWSSPITSDSVVAGSLRLGETRLDGGELYWLEGRPNEGGRQVVVQQAAGAPVDRNPAPFNARTRLHEYGGGAYLVHDGVVYFSNFRDQRLYRAAAGSAPEPITAEVPVRYSDGVMDDGRGRLICVCEDHTQPGQEAENYVAAVSLDGAGTISRLAAGRDFYAYPRLSPDGSRLCWVCWDHPNMPWDDTELWVADLDATGAVVRSERVAGGPDESIFQPQWSPDGVLYYMSDRSGWWNLYRRVGDQDEALAPMEAECGAPLWVLGLSTYSFESGSRLVMTYSRDGAGRLVLLDTTTLERTELDLPFTSFGAITASADTVAFVGASPTEPAQVIRLRLSDQRIERLRAAFPVDPEHVRHFSIPHAIEFPTEGGRTAHAFYYPPQNADFAAPAGERAPLLVKSHGGPTSSTSNTLSLAIQYWTSRGIAVVDVNYGGSTGFGREYRNRLRDAWGIVDVEDCVNAARFLADQGLADGARMAITGGSAGGYTTLCALAFRDVFKAGASHFGVSDLEGLALETHKFESRYLDRLIGPYPERKDLYIARSAVHHPEGISVPVAFFQGDEDEIVLPNQTERMVDALKERGLPVLYLLFQGEQHGFRKAENIRRALDAELYFYAIHLIGAGLRY